LIHGHIQKRQLEQQKMGFFTLQEMIVENGGCETFCPMKIEENT
jgi:hypothetical protein